MSSPLFADLKTHSKHDIDIYIRDVDLSIVNSLRRVIISEIQNVGFHFDPNDFRDDKDIQIVKNDTPLHNEFVQKRISLIPIHVNVDELNDWNPDDYVFEINKINKSGELLNVYSSDFVVSYKNKVDTNLSKRFFPPDPITKHHILITKIIAKDNSAFVMKARAIKACPKFATSFGMVSDCAVEFLVDDDLSNKKRELYLKENASKMSQSDLQHQFDTIERERYYYRNRYREPNRFKLHITSECSIPSTYIMSQAIKVLKTKVLKMKQTEHDIVKQHDMFTIIVRDESHTLGNMFQAISFNKYYREVDANDKFSLKYIGYNQPHPLEELILVKIRGDKINDVDDVRSFINDACDNLLSELTELENQWNTISNQ